MALATIMKKVIYISIFLTLILYLQACDYESPSIDTPTNPEPEINSGAGREGNMSILHAGIMDTYIAHTGRLNGKGSKILLDQASYEIELANIQATSQLLLIFLEAVFCFWIMES